MAVDNPQQSRWPLARRAAWAVLFIAMLSWSSLVTPTPPPEVLDWGLSVGA